MAGGERDIKEKWYCLIGPWKFLSKLIRILDMGEGVNSGKRLGFLYESLYAESKGICFMMEGLLAMYYNMEDLGETWDIQNDHLYERYGGLKNIGNKRYIRQKRLADQSSFFS